MKRPNRSSGSAGTWTAWRREPEQTPAVAGAGFWLIREALPLPGVAGTHRGSDQAFNPRPRPVRAGFVGDLVVNTLSRQVTVGGVPVALSATEFQHLGAGPDTAASRPVSRNRRGAPTPSPRHVDGGRR